MGQTETRPRARTNASEPSEQLYLMEGDDDFDDGEVVEISKIHNPKVRPKKKVCFRFPDRLTIFSPTDSGYFIVRLKVFYWGSYRNKMK